MPSKGFGMRPLVREFIGQLTGQRFGFPITAMEDSPGSSEAYEGRNLGTNETVFIQYLRTVTSDAPETVRRAFDAALERARAAIDVAQLPAVAGCPEIVRLLDFRDERYDDEFGPPFDVLVRAWEWGDTDLGKTIAAGDVDADALANEVEEGVRPALACLHSAGLVHSDVAPNNIIRGAGRWKLGDLDTCIATSDAIVGLPRDRRYVLADLKIGDPARPEADTYGLAAVLDEIRSSPR